MKEDYFLAGVFQELFDAGSADLEKFVELCEDFGYDCPDAADFIKDYIERCAPDLTSETIDLIGVVFAHIYDKAKSEIEDKIGMDLEDCATYYTNYLDCGLNVIEEEKVKEILEKMKKIPEEDLSKETKYILEKLEDSL
jgi:hypothetical protein